MTRTVKALTASLPKEIGKSHIWQGLNGASQMLALAQNSENENRPIIVIAPDVLTQETLKDELKFFLDEKQCELPFLTLPDNETLPYDYFSPHPDLISERLKTLNQIPHLKKGFLFVAASTLLSLLPPQKFIQSRSLLLSVKETINIDEFRLKLQSAGYRNVNQVMEHGEFAVRGSIIDLFPMGSSTPYRIDLFGDEIDSIRTFDSETQLSKEKIDSIKLLPAKEFPLDKDGIVTFRSKWREFFSGNPSNIPLYQNISDGQSAPGVEYYLPLFFDELNSLFDYLPKNSLIVSFNNLQKQTENFFQEIESRYSELSHDKNRPILAPEKIFIAPAEIVKELNNFAHLVITENTEAPNNNEATSFKSFDLPKIELNKISLLDPKRRTIFISPSQGRKEYLKDLLKKENLYPEHVNYWHEFLDNDFINLATIVAPLKRGLKLLDTESKEEILLLTETELFDKTPVTRRRSKKEKARKLENLVNNLTQLTIGSPIVHIEHGVGRYLGLQNLPIGEVETEFLLLEYAKGAKLYVPVTSLHLISRYSGADAEHSPLDHLGSMRWKKTKSKVKKAIRDVAHEILKIYAQRSIKKAYQFSPPDDSYDKFCDLFPFEETEDQDRAIDAVIHDLTQSKPMDRIICGDVGFGKTEVAMRAAFIAASQGKQVALLAPTTLLVEQHYQNFLDRFAQFPLKIAMLSRFISSKKQKENLALIAEGKVDIVIGTHKLLQKDVKFKNLGLLIIDEEHRFGVKHKEKIKALAPNIHILTLTATPIPRTLNMALSGLRDFSIIATPPEGRLSIKTFIRPKLDHLIREAIMRELLRGGQVYFLHNKVASIERVAKNLEKLVPKARIAFAHGQMREKELEKIMRDFHMRRINILVSTTIIESGIDIPTANTIIIDRADRFGLAELHQLRGRVGRSHHQAYAYLLIPEKDAMTKNAKKRLEALAEMEDLGIGFTLATRDLEIRGAGELLGEKQSGVMHEVGFDLYMETLERAVHALKNGEEFAVETDEASELVDIELNIPALITDKYMPDVNMRLVFYKRIAGAKNEPELRDLQVELIDRFGLLPQETKNIFFITELKLEARKIGANKIKGGDKKVTIEFNETDKVDTGKIIELIREKSQTFKLKNGNQLEIDWSNIKNIEEKTTFICKLFNDIAKK